MKNIKKYIPAIFGAFLFSAILFPVELRAQDSSLQRGVRIESHNTTMDEANGMASTAMVVELKNVTIPNRSQLRITPYLQNGNNRKPLPPIAVNGRLRDRLIERARVLGGDIDYAYITKVARETYTGKLDYVAEYPVEPWMNDSRLMLLVEEIGCAGMPHTLSDNLIASGLMLSERPEPARYIADIFFIVPEREPVKNFCELGEAYVLYIVGRSDIRPELGNNRYELEKILKSIECIREEPTARISGISIRSFASPEGTWESNLRLSERRAASLAQWVRDNADIQGIDMSYVGLGEDWERLDSLVSVDQVLSEADKNYVLDLIRNVGLFEGRENRLMAHNGGATYRYLLNNLFPLLRRSDYRIDYTVPEFSLEKSMQVFRIRPGLLSLAEFNDIAGQYPKGSPEFNEVFEVASKVYPDDKTASLNAAAAQLASGSVETAKDMLERYKDDPQAWINLGNIAAMEGDFEQAESYFRRAKAAGIPEAEKYIKYLSDYIAARQG